MNHYIDVIMRAVAPQITSVFIAYSTVCSGVDQRKHQSSASPTFVRGIHWWPVNSPHKGPVTQKMFPFDDVIMITDLINAVIEELVGTWGNEWMKSICNVCMCLINLQGYSTEKVPVLLKAILWTSYQIRKIAGWACTGNAGNVFPATDFKGNR